MVYTRRVARHKEEITRPIVLTLNTNAEKEHEQEREGSFMTEQWRDRSSRKGLNKESHGTPRR